MAMRRSEQSKNDDEWNNLNNSEADMKSIKSNNVEVVKMEKTIGLVSSINIIVGSMIGSGIFVSPTGIVMNVKSLGLSLIIWVACGLYSLLGALCYAELGTLIHRSGADYAYFYEAFGGFAAFLRLWIEIIVVRPASAGAIAIAFGKYALAAIYPSCDPPELYVRLVGFLSILLVTFLNCISVRVATRVQDIFTFAKLFALLVIIGTGIYNMSVGRLSEFEDMFTDTDYSFGAIVQGFYSGLFAYSGWNYLNCMIEEMKNPKRDLPISIVFSCLLVTAIYTFAVASYATAVTIGETLTSSALAMLFAKRMYGVMWLIMPIFVSLSCFGGMNGTMLTTSRIFYVAAQNQHMPPIFSMIHRTKLTPIPAVFFTGLTSICYLLFPNLYDLMTCLGFVQWTSIALSVFIVLFLRWKRPQANRTVKVPIILPVIYLVFSVFLVIFSFQAAPVLSLIGCSFVLSGIPVYILCISMKKPERFQRWVMNLTIWNQKVFEIVPTH